MDATENGKTLEPHRDHDTAEQLRSWLPGGLAAAALLIHAVVGGGELGPWPMLLLWVAILDATLRAGRAEKGGPAGKLQPERARVTGRSR